MHYSQEEKKKLLKDWKRSRKSISAYTRDNGLVRWTFTKWIKAERDSKQSFVEVSQHIMPQQQQLMEILIEKGDVKIHIPLIPGSCELRSVMEGLGAAL